MGGPPMRGGWGGGYGGPGGYGFNNQGYRGYYNTAYGHYMPGHARARVGGGGPDPEGPHTDTQVC